ncbi:MAG: cytochrome b561 [Pseudohongiellaceae bacterium]|jgi:cytochrome b561
MVAIYGSIELHETIPRGNPLRAATEDWHIYLGFTILVLALARLFINMRLTAPPISPNPPSWQMLATKGMKIYLYALMLIMPILGWLYLSANDEAINWFFIPLPAIAPVSETIAEFAGEAHEIFGLSGYLFIGIHAAAALYHHYLVKDDTLRRMLP